MLIARHTTVAEGADEKSSYADSIEDEEQLPVGCVPVGMIHRGGASDKRGGSKVDGQNDSPITDKPGPSGNEREQRTTQSFL